MSYLSLSESCGGDLPVCLTCLHLTPVVVSYLSVLNVFMSPVVMSYLSI